MARFATWLTSDLTKPNKPQMLSGCFFSGDASGNLIGVTVLNNGEAATLSGTVTGEIIRPDNATIEVGGTLSGNNASIVLPSAAYILEGALNISIKLTASGVVTTLGACKGYVVRTTTDVIVDPGETVAIVRSVNGITADADGNVQISATDITSGTFATARIPNLAASKITSGTFNADRLPNMVGATANSAGTKGAVPAPSAGSQDKLLKGDGTWVAVSNGAAGSNAPASAGALYTLQQNFTTNQAFVTPEDFGAAATKDYSVDDATYISQAIASGKPVMLKRSYMVRSEIVVTQAFNMGTMFGLPWATGGITFTNGGKFTLNCEYATFSNIYFYGYNEGGEGQYSVTPLTINGANGLDGDAEFNQCIFSGLSVAIRANARGLWIKNCLFARCEKATELNYVGTTTDTSASTSKKYGGRNFLFEGNRYHSGVSFTVYIIAGSSAYGLLYEGNISDHGGAGIRVDGDLRCAAIVGNSFNLAGIGNMILYTASGSVLEDVVIANNTATSVAGTASTSVSYRDMLFYGEDINRLHITGNALDGCGYESILFAPTGTPNIRNVLINGNTFANISQLSNNVGYGAIGLPNSCSNITIVGNSFSNIPSTIYCIRCNLSTTPTISNLNIMLNTHDGSGAGLIHPSLTASDSIMNVLPVANGGTGATTVAGARNALGLGNTSGALPIANGGTGQTTVAAARNALGLGNTNGALPIANGGTGATTAAAARNALGLGNTDGAVPIANGGTGATTAAAAIENLGLKLTYKTMAVNSSISAQAQLYVYTTLPSGTKPIGCWFEASGGSTVLIVSSPVYATNGQVLARIYNPGTAAVTATGTMYFLFIPASTLVSA